MATSNHFLEKISDITECPVCAEMMVDPKMLPCIHTFCLKCLNRFLEDKVPCDKIPCPLCRTEFKIPHGGLEQLQNNIFVQRLIDAQNYTQAKDEAAKCDICACRKIEKVAVRFCMECQQNFCDQCLEVHASMSSSKFHQMSSLEHKTGLKDTDEFSESHFCHHHMERKSEIYCKECRIVVCTVCFLAEHKQHDASDVDEFVKNEKKRIANNVETISSRLSGVRKKMDLLKTRMQHLTEPVEQTERMIIERGEELKRVVDEHVRVLIEKLKLEKTGSVKEMENAREELQCQQISLESYINYSDKVLKQATPSYVVNVAHDMDVRAEELKRLNDIGVEHLCDEVVFIPYDFLASRPNIIGTIDKGECLSKPLTYTQHSKLIESIQFEAVVRGVTRIEHELYVVIGKNNNVKTSKVHIFDASTYELKTTFQLEEAMNPYGFTADINYLYISYQEDGRIHKVHIRDQSVTSWEVGGELNRLSLTKQGNILVTCYDSNKLCKYTTMGVLLKTIQLEPDLYGPRHAIQLDTDRYLLTQSIDGGSNRVCIIDDSGRLISSYGGKAGSNFGQLKKHSELAVDRNGFIFVTCVEDDKVTLLNSKLEFVNYIIQPSVNISRCLTICLDEFRGRLYVSDFSQDNLLVFELN